MDALIAVDPAGASASIRLPSAVVLPIGTKSMCTSSPIAPTTTSPEFSPQRTANSTPSRRATSAASSATSRWSSSTARHARRAWSSCASGAPKTASRPSPVNWLTVPSNAWTAPAAIPRKRSRTKPQRSLSSERVSSIEPTMSAYITVTCLRSPSIAGALLEDLGLERARRPQRRGARGQRRAAPLAEPRALGGARARTPRSVSTPCLRPA